MKKNNTPRHKRLNREGRLRAVKSWLRTYNGKNIVRGYSKHFAIDLLGAVRELEMIGISIEDNYKKELRADLQNKIKRKEMIKQKKVLDEQNITPFYSEYMEELEDDEDIELLFSQIDESLKG
ncbi:hypothetical protein [Paenibacillus sp. PAMC 26794]|uniref:hypothetical protein n=1 Tax=Paenibacillus sp. PAMC 26794 TaxID=1257080 RepID=UPI0002DF5E52|nr:hypothetical protein [Paenibacillus sp. PAMC 26794]